MDSALPKGIWIAIVVALAVAMGAMHYALRDGMGTGDQNAGQAEVGEKASAGGLSRQPVEVVLDPGHGGDDGGTVVFSLLEKELVLDISQRVRRELARHKIRAVMTREEDVQVELPDRVAIARKHPGVPFVSIHLNRFRKPSVAGMEVYVHDGDPVPVPRAAGHDSGAKGGELQWLNDGDGERNTFYDRRSTTLAHLILDAVTTETKLNDRGVRQKNLFVVKNTPPPSVLVECGYLSNPNDARKFAKAAFRETVAKAIARGIMEFLEGSKTDPTYGFDRTGELGNSVLTVK
ncbi:N-acetylmuramoyl-L-alanine amidase family protein [Sulfuriroseicoccus oceanibius]|uniref:N-acetylmuramoyl-L-alanine amidase n=1 Tax=Sulfuriroseicoccus oceanibius TaxID=2707525 RepID=A0A6B3LEV4_9BACT|nr:N-acetylmuramoyl-L-alanine amidase [Sulfuriroseicoccus oceanibius]QQL45180.1 N-acetylmuramoyl-L-alanine amidase [Sulfuriroseicoccus oceanibius]